MVAAFDTLEMRLLGIGLASFSSGQLLLLRSMSDYNSNMRDVGLGELTFLQLSTKYHPSSVGGHSIGYIAV